MKCVFCGKDLTKGRETIERRIKGKLYYIKYVPADICKSCGEIYIDDAIVSIITKALEGKNIIQSTGTEVLDFKDLTGFSNDYFSILNENLELI